MHPRCCSICMRRTRMIRRSCTTMPCACPKWAEERSRSPCSFTCSTYPRITATVALRWAWRWPVPDGSPKPNRNLRRPSRLNRTTSTPCVCSARWRRVPVTPMPSNCCAAHSRWIRTTSTHEPTWPSCWSCVMIMNRECTPTGPICYENTESPKARFPPRAVTTDPR